VPKDGGWSPRMVVHHLADSESNSTRGRKLLAEDDPVVQGYDQAYARRLHYDRPVETSLAVFRAVRASTAELLERLEEQDWGRAGTHTESGPYTDGRLARDLRGTRVRPRGADPARSRPD